MSLPFVSVLCPIRNEEQHIVACVNSIRQQDYDASRYEIIILDGMSDDRTRELICRMQQSDARLKLLDNPKRIVPTAMNLGIRAARGEIIIRLDGHATIPRNYISKCVEHLEKTGAACVGGPIESLNTTYIGRAIALAMSFPFGVGNARFRTSNYSGEVDTLAFGAYRREVFEEIGSFDEELVRCQDDELNYRLRKRGGKIFMTPEIRSSYFPRQSLKKLWRQYFGYGFWKVRVLQKHASMMQPRQFVPGAFVCSLMLSPLSAAFIQPAWLLCGGILGAYLSANVLASAVLALKRGVRYFPLLPVVFMLLHFSYGWGFLKGLIKFAGRWRENKD